MTTDCRKAVNNEILAAREAELPEHMVRALKRYVSHGDDPGNFLRAVLANDLISACDKADSINIKLLPQYARYMYNNMPAGSWGSTERISAWRHKKQQGWSKRNGNK
jgi:hypothetical protein